MPTSILERVVDSLDVAEKRGRGRLPEHVLSTICPVDEGCVPCRAAVLLQCPACRSADVAQVLGDNGGVSYVCTACGHSWS